MKKEKLTYLESVHRDGRIWGIIVAIALLAFPLSLSLLFGDLHHIAGEGCLMILSQAAPAPAGDHTLGCLHIIKAAERAQNAPGCSFFHQFVNTTEVSHPSE